MMSVVMSRPQDQKDTQKTQTSCGGATPHLALCFEGAGKPAPLAVKMHDKNTTIIRFDVLETGFTAVKGEFRYLDCIYIFRYLGNSFWGKFIQPMEPLALIKKISQCVALA
jgi:hypothetical protein